MTTKTRMSAFALALAAFTATTFLAGSSAPAGTGLVLKRPLPPGATSVVGTKTTAPTPAGGLITKLPPGELNQLLTDKLPPRGIGPICPLFRPGCGPIPRPPATGGHGWDRDRDHDHDYGWDRDHDHDYGYGYDRDHYFHHNGWRFMPPVVVEGTPGEVMTAPVMQGGPVRAPAAAPQAMGVPLTAPGPQLAGEPCNCLTKQSLPDGSVLFQDVCTKESAIAPPQAVGMR